MQIWIHLMCVLYFKSVVVHTNTGRVEYVFARICVCLNVFVNKICKCLYLRIQHIQRVDVCVSWTLTVVCSFDVMCAIFATVFGLRTESKRDDGDVTHSLWELHRARKCQRIMCLHLAVLILWSGDGTLLKSGNLFGFFNLSVWYSANFRSAERKVTRAKNTHQCRLQW